MDDDFFEDEGYIEKEEAEDISDAAFVDSFDDNEEEDEAAYDDGLQDEPEEVTEVFDEDMEDDAFAEEEAVTEG